MPHYLVDISFRGPPSETLMGEQKAFLEALTKSRSLLLSAACERPGTSLAILIAPSLDAAKAMYDAAPFAQADLIDVAVSEIRPMFGLAVGL